MGKAVAERALEKGIKGMYVALTVRVPISWSCRALWMLPVKLAFSSKVRCKDGSHPKQAGGAAGRKADRGKAVSKTVKGSVFSSFTALTVVGDGNGRVGFGYGKESA